MKKIFLLIILLLSFLVSCNSNSITDTVYIASIGIDYENEEYVGYFYLPNSVDVGGIKSEEGGSFIATTRSESLIDIFNQVLIKNNVYVSFRHISSIIFSNKLFDNLDIDLLINYIKESQLFDFNFYIFATEDNIEKIYDLKNPNNEEITISMLLNPNDYIYEYLYGTPVHFLKFANYYYSNRSLKIPLIKEVEIWKNNDEKDYGYSEEGILLYNRTSNYFCYEKDFMLLKNNKEIYIEANNINAILYDYKIDLGLNDILEFNISYKYKILAGEEEKIPEYIKSGISNILAKYSSKIDFLNLEYFNRLLNKNTSYSNISYKIKASLK